MTFEQLYSSSTGNLYTVTAANGRRLLLECGVRWAQLQNALNYDLTKIDGCLLTHEHADHSKAVKEVMQAGIDVYASAGTFEALGVNGNRKAKTIASHVGIIGDSFNFYGFPLNHDAAEPFGFIIRSRQSNEHLLFVPDASHINQRFATKFSIITIGCIYDIDVLQHRVDTQDINESLAKRLLTSHMEKKVTMKYLSEFCDLSRCREIHLLHMGNIDKEKTKTEFEKKFFVETRIVEDAACRTDNRI